MKSLLIIALSVVFLGATPPAADPDEILLWPNGAPGSEGQTAPDVIKLTGTGERVVTGVNKPSITPYLPAKDKATGAAVVIAPGGGHYQLSMDSEGHNVGRWLAEHGVAAFVLKYRLAKGPNSPYTVEGHEMADMRRSIRIIRSRNKEWGVDTAKIGVLGFSAGGELAAYAAMHYDNGLEKPGDTIDKEGSKPAFQALIYPGSSSKYVVTKNTPPVFIVCGYKDRADISRGMAELYLKYKDLGVPAELHIYSGSGHGFGLRATDRKPEVTWPSRLHEWMGDMGYLKK